MKPIAHLIAVTALPCALSVTAHAADAPSLRPVRNATVTYKVVKAVVENQSTKHVVIYDVGQKVERLDMYALPNGKYPFEGAIYKAGAQQLLTMHYAQRVVYQANGDLYGIPGISRTEKMTYVRKADSSVDGKPCTDWEVNAPGKESWVGCIDKDGLLLRSVSPTRTLEVLSVSFDPVPLTALEPPADLRPRPAPTDTRPALPGTKK